jgi:hypothetical protein
VPPPDLTMLFGIDLEPLANITTCSVEANSSRFFEKHSSVTGSVVRGQMRYEYPPPWLNAMYLQIAGSRRHHAMRV